MAIITLKPTSDNYREDSWCNLSDSGTSNLYSTIDEDTLSEADGIMQYLLGGGTNMTANVLFNWENPSVSSGTITDVIFYAYAKSYQNTNTSRIKFLMIGTDHASAEVTPSTTTTLYHNHYTTNPHTGVAWTWVNITDLVAGFWGIYTNTKGGDLSYPLIYQTYIQVEYTPFCGQVNIF